MWRKRHLHPNVHRSTIYNSQDVQRAKMSTVTGMHAWVKKMWYVYTMECDLAIKKEWNNAFSSNMDGPGHDHTKWRTSERGQIACDITRRCYLVKWAYFQNRNKLTENQLTATSWEGSGGGIDWESGFDMYTRLYWKQITKRDLA